MIANENERKEKTTKWNDLPSIENRLWNAIGSNSEELENTTN